MEKRNKYPVIFRVIVQGAVRQAIHFRGIRISGYRIGSLQRDDYAFDPFSAFSIWQYSKYLTDFHLNCSS